MILSHIEAIVKASDRSFYAEVDGVRIWSNGHIALPGDWPADRQYSYVADAWKAGSSRSVEVAIEGRLRKEAGAFYRALIPAVGQFVWINEACLRTFRGDGISTHIDGPNRPIVFRRDGELVALAMPVKDVKGDEAAEATDAEVFERFAREENGFYLQSTEWIERHFDSLIKEARVKVEQAISRTSDAEEEESESKNELADVKRKAKEFMATR